MVGHEIWRETLKNLQKETHTLQDPEYGEKQWKSEKCEIQTVGPGLWQAN